jgi:multiple sugar transport system permease protein/raffinose/stachyose/melibiose transport system permease protein
MFDQAFIFSNGSGGPNDSTLTMTLHIYKMGFNSSLNSMGYASTLAIFLAVVIFTISFVVRRFFGEED